MVESSNQSNDPARSSSSFKCSEQPVSSHRCESSSKIQEDATRFLVDLLLGKSKECPLDLEDGIRDQSPS
eukprot:7742005-Heterocapsa_arctica.AAC.1